MYSHVPCAIVCAVLREKRSFRQIFSRDGKLKIIKTVLIKDIIAHFILKVIKILIIFQISIPCLARHERSKSKT